MSSLRSGEMASLMYETVPDFYNPLPLAENLSLDMLGTAYELVQDRQSRITYPEEAAYVLGSVRIEQALHPSTSPQTAAEYFAEADDKLAFAGDPEASPLSNRVLINLLRASIPFLQARKTNTEVSDDMAWGVAENMAPAGNFRSEQETQQDKNKVAIQVVLPLLLIREGLTPYISTFRELVWSQPKRLPEDTILDAHRYYLIDKGEKLPFNGIGRMTQTPDITVVSVPLGGLIRSAFIGADMRLLNRSKALQQIADWAIEDARGGKLEQRIVKALDILGTGLVEYLGKNLD